MIPDSAIHGGHHVTLGVGMQQREDLLGLVLDATLFTLQAFQVPNADFTKLCKAFAQLFHLGLVISRRSMSGIDPALARLAFKQPVTGDFRERSVVDDDRFFGDPHR